MKKQSADDVLNMIRARGDIDSAEMESMPTNDTNTISLKWVYSLGAVLVILLAMGDAKDRVEHLLNPELAKAEQIALAQEQSRKRAKELETKRKGFHCLSSWDGSLKNDRAFKNRLKDPKSYDHIETLITPNRNGYHKATIRYRARNSFGGMIIETTQVLVSNSTCNIVG